MNLTHVRLGFCGMLIALAPAFVSNEQANRRHIEARGPESLSPDGFDKRPQMGPITVQSTSNAVPIYTVLAAGGPSSSSSTSIMCTSGVSSVASQQ